jgi:translocation and assembly module TamB
MWRVGKILLAALLLLLVLAGGTVFWIVESASGTRWLWNRVTAAVPGELSAGAIRGALADGFAVTDVRYVDDGIEVSLSSAEFSLEPRLFPIAARLVDLEIGDVLIRQRTAPATDSATDSATDGEGASLRSILSLLQLPVPVDIETLSLDSLRILSSGAQEFFVLEAANLSGRWHREIAVERASAQVGNASLAAEGRLGLAAPHAVNGVVSFRYAQDDSEPLNVSATLAGDLDDLHIDTTSDSPKWRVTGNIRQIDTHPDWDLRLQAESLQWPLEADEPLIRGSSVDLRSSGGLSNYTLAGTATALVRDLGELALSIDASGDVKSIDVADLQAAGERLNASASGRLDWADDIALAVNAHIDRFDPQRLVPGWPADRYVSGEIDAAWRGGSVELAMLSLQVADTPMTLASAGTVDTARGIVDLDIDWENLQWPLGGNPQVESGSGRIRLDGEPADWTVDGRLSLEFPGYPAGDFVLRGTGDREQLALTIDESALLGGTVAGQLQYNWHRGGEWTATLDARSLHTEPLAPDWPGILNARIDGEGQRQPLRLKLAIGQFDGSLRGVPVEGQGGIEYATGKLVFREFHVSSEDSSLGLDGSLWDGDGVDFQLDVDVIGTIVRGAAGSVSARGNVAMTDDFPVLRMQLAGQDLAWEGIRAGSLKVSSSEPTRERPLDVSIEGRDVSIDGRHFQAVTLQLSGAQAAQRIAVDIAHEDAVLNLVLDGALADWNRPLQSEWSGMLESLSLSAGEDVHLEMEDPVALRISQDVLVIDDACLVGNAGMRICGSAERTGAEALQASAEFAEIPLGMLELAVDTELAFTQTLGGTMSLTRIPGRGLSGDVSIDLTAGNIRYRADSRLATATGPGRLRLRLDDGKLLSGEVALPFGRASTIDGAFDVADVGMGDASRIDGQLAVQVADIGVVASFLPMFAEASGRLEADVGIRGTVGQPAFTGQGFIRDGSLVYDPLGLRLTDLQLSGDIREQNRVELQGTFRAGDGVGQIRTSADYLAGSQADLQVFLSGENLTVIDVPDVGVIANPDLEIGLQEGRLVINGEVVVPRARLSPANLATGTARESDDVVIVAGQDADIVEEPAEEPTLEIVGRVNLVLGDDIVIDLDVADATVRGEATFEWSGPPMPVADGQYRVAGDIQAYGQLLQITEGTVSFADVPADNPQLRIRAEREIFGNSQVRSAGIFITGTAKNPDVEIYTNPATNESRALTMLITGSDFNFEQGVGAVDVGTYIAPKLYLSYGIGLFDRQNVISVRYDLARGFGIKASSGSRSDGIDLSYTLER